MTDRRSTDGIGLRRHRRRTLSGTPRRPEGGRPDRSDRHRRRSESVPAAVGPFDIVERRPTEYTWRTPGCHVRLRLAHNRWDTIFATGAGEPQIESHHTLTDALAYARGFMESGTVGVRTDRERAARSDDDPSLLDDVEIAIGAMAAAIERIPDIDAVGDLLLENE